MLSVIVGLGNPGREYENTRHNVGFVVVDSIRARIAPSAERQCRCASHVYVARGPGRQLFLAQPQTFMNNSGRAVAKLVRSLGVLPEQVLVVYDCLDLALGRLRIRRRGSSGGHRGVDSIITELGSDAFARLRIGIGRPRGETLDHVLSAWQHDEAPLVEQVLETAAAAALLAVRRGVDVAMNTYNGWQAETLSADTDGN